jgi:hypothetical protein
VVAVADDECAVDVNVVDVNVVVASTHSGVMTQSPLVEATEVIPTEVAHQTCPTASS